MGIVRKALGLTVSLKIAHISGARERQAQAYQIAKPQALLGAWVDWNCRHTGVNTGSKPSIAEQLERCIIPRFVITERLSVP